MPFVPDLRGEGGDKRAASMTAKRKRLRGEEGEEGRGTHLPGTRVGQTPDVDVEFRVGWEEERLLRMASGEIGSAEEMFSKGS